MATEKFANFAQTTLTSGVTSSTNPLPVVSASGFPSAPQYRVLIDTELVLVTGAAGSTSWSVTRGVEGTTAASHSAGATVTEVLTAGALDQARLDNLALSLVEGRLTLQSGTPVPTTDLTAQATVYFTPYLGSRLALYSGTEWVVDALAEISISLNPTQTGTTTNGSAVVTGLSDTSQLIVGMAVTGTGIPAATTIASINSSTQVTLNHTATASGSPSLTFAVPATTNLDLFAYDNAGTPKLEMVAWSNNTTRATALGTQNGVLVKSTDATRRYLGTARTTATNGKCEDSKLNRFLWNYYHRLRRPFRLQDSANSWTYSTAAWRFANGNTSNFVAAVVGVQEVLVDLTLLVDLAYTVSGTAYFSIGEDITSGFTADSIGNYAFLTGGANYVAYTAYLRHLPTAGYHAWNWLESGVGSGTTGWLGGGYSNNGLTGWIEG